MPEQNLSWEILDYRGKSSGETIPQWLNSFLEGGISAVERLEEFQNYYTFISMNSGTNINALKQWSTGFSPDLDFARLIAVRIENRFLRAARTYPDEAYGSYFIALIRSASDALWEGAVRDSDFWLFRTFYETDDEDRSSWEHYDFFILVKVEKNLLVPQIRTLLENVQPQDPLSPDQNAAVSQVQRQFFESF